MGFRPTNKKNAPKTTTGMTAGISISDHLRLPLTTKTWQQSIVKNYTMRVISHRLMLRDTPHERGMIILELVMHSTVKLGTEESQFSDNTLWKNVISGSVKGWVLASGLESYDQSQQFHPDHTTADPLTLLTTCQTDSHIAKSEGIFTPLSASMIAPLSALTDNHLCRVLLKDLALRTGPDIKSRLIKKLDEGQIVECNTQQMQGNWVTISADGDHGWVASHWLQPLADHDF